MDESERERERERERESSGGRKCWGGIDGQVDGAGVRSAVGGEREVRVETIFIRMSDF